jgi:hypothetical protein
MIALLCCPFITKSQDETLYTKQITPDETPQAVKEALKKDFPEAVADIQFYMVPDNIVDSEWGALMSEKVAEGDNQYYEVKLKGSGGGFVYGLYNRNGELEVLKMEALDFEIPENIRTHATTGKYEGYEVQSQKYSCHKVIDKRTNNEFVEVQVKKGDDTKTLVYRLNGDFIKEK